MCCTMWGLHWFWIMPIIFMILMFVCATFMFRRARGWRWCAGDRANWRPYGCRNNGQHSTARRWSETPR